MPKPWLTNGREVVTRDTPIGGCHVTSRCTVTHRDNVTSYHAVTFWRSRLEAEKGNGAFSGNCRWGQPAGRARVPVDPRCCAAHRPQGCAL